MSCAGGFQPAGDQTDAAALLLFVDQETAAFRGDRRSHTGAIARRRP